ncbi:hypothetical protein BDV26DRAFT_110688 [Aspergillus bertholletiae]|uniref:Uncharacterized protein n=1 Tax=Aspergillus bertholletiae TaxID=1226010 RepID=A0A5N7BGS1_9EURO|nr:hypothetical protein BDV26DRAFT_110688 [Aspergillus bertholletiae]
MSLTPNSIYIALYIRTDPPIPDNFHWALYLHRHDAGNKYHITNESTGWVAAHAPESAILKSFLLVGLIRLADLPSSQAALDEADQLIRSYDNQVNEMGFTCRTWLFKVLELLKKKGLLCGDKDLDMRVLEREVMDWGNEEAGDAVSNVQPRPVRVSAVCGFEI